VFFFFFLTMHGKAKFKIRYGTNFLLGPKESPSDLKLNKIIPCEDQNFLLTK